VVVVMSEAGMPVLTPDPRRRQPGRGASLHPDVGCFERAVRAKAFVRALRIRGPLDVEEVRRYLAADNDSRGGTEE